MAKWARWGLRSILKLMLLNLTSYYFNKNDKINSVLWKNIIFTVVCLIDRGPILANFYLKKLSGFCLEGSTKNILLFLAIFFKFVSCGAVRVDEDFSAIRIHTIFLDPSKWILWNKKFNLDQIFAFLANKIPHFLYFEFLEINFWLVLDNFSIFKILVQEVPMSR